MTELYRSEDAQQILQIAIARQAEAGELSRAQLYEIAAELNIAAVDLEQAEQEWQIRKGELADRQVFIRLRQSQFKQRLVRFLIVNGFLLALNLLISPGWLWALYVALFWGIGVALDAWRTYGMGQEEFELAFQGWQQRQKLKRSVSTALYRLNQWIGG